MKMIDILGAIVLVLVTLAGFCIKLRTRRRLAAMDGLGGVFQRGSTDPESVIGVITSDEYDGQ